MRPITLFSLAIALYLAACVPVQGDAPAGDAGLQVIVQFSRPDLSAQQAEQLVSDISGVQARLQSGVSATTYALRLSCGSTTDCAAAVERLRKDARITSAVIDQRRMAH